MKAGSRVKLLSAGWQVAHVRPLPSNRSLKKRSAPRATSSPRLVVIATLVEPLMTPALSLNSRVMRLLAGSNGTDSDVAANTPKVAACPGAMNLTLPPPTAPFEGSVSRTVTLTGESPRFLASTVMRSPAAPAFEFFRRAGTCAGARSASRAAVACFGQALGALEHLPESPDTIRLAIDLHRELHSAYLLLGELPRMLDSLREAERLAKGLGDEHLLARVWAHVTICCWWMGQLETAVEYAQQALAAARSVRDFGLEILAGVRLGLNYLYLGQYRQAIEILQGYMDTLSGDLARERFEMASLPAVSGRVYLSNSLASLGDFTAAAPAAEEALAIAMAADHPYSVTLAWFGVGRTSVAQGNFREALPWLERSLAACRRQDFYLFSSAAALAGRTYVRLGRVADGIALLGEAAEREGATGFGLYRPERLAALAEAYLLSGRVDDALRAARQALDVSRAGKQRGFEADTLHLLGEIHARPGSPDSHGGQAFYQEALALAAELGMRPLVARCHLGLGRLYRQAGQGASAKEHLGTARTMLAQMEMGFWLEQAEAELTLT